MKRVVLAVRLSCVPTSAGCQPDVLDGSANEALQVSEAAPTPPLTGEARIVRGPLALDPTRGCNGYGAAWRVQNASRPSEKRRMRPASGLFCLELRLGPDGKRWNTVLSLVVGAPPRAVVIGLVFWALTIESRYAYTPPQNPRRDSPRSRRRSHQPAATRLVDVRDNSRYRGYTMIPLRTA